MVTTRRSAHPRPATAGKRTAILDAAMVTFGRLGYGKGPLTEIADQVGMTHAGVLHHFGSKDDLLVEVLKHRDEVDLAGLPTQTLPGGMELFRHLIHTAMVNATRPGIVRTYAVLSAESVTEGHPAREFFIERFAGLRADITAAFDLVCADRGITDLTTVRHASAAILAVMDGLQVQWLLTPDDVDLAEATAFAIEAIAAQVFGPREIGVQPAAA